MHTVRETKIMGSVRVYIYDSNIAQINRKKILIVMSSTKAEYKAMPWHEAKEVIWVR